GWADSSAISSPRRSISAAVIRKSLCIGDSSVGLRRLYTAIFEASWRRQDGPSPADPQFFGGRLSSPRLDAAKRGGGAFARCRGYASVRSCQRCQEKSRVHCPQWIGLDTSRRRLCG